MTLGGKTKRAAAALLLSAALLLPSAAADPPYARQLGRLAEILGSLHYLAGLCGPTPSPFRAEMEGLLDAEAPAEPLRAELVDRFNLGFSSFAAVYRRCTAMASDAIAVYRAEGAALATMIANEFGAPAIETTPLPAG